MNAAILFLPKIAASQSVPPFRMQLTNGQFFSFKDVSHEKPLIIIYFSPDCEHCQKLIKELLSKINNFKKAQIVMVSFLPLKDLVDFEKNYSINKFPNIKVGMELPIFFFKNLYNLQNTPFTALFSKHGKLIISYKKETPVDDLIKHLKAL